MAELQAPHTKKQIFIADMMLVAVAFIWGAGIPISALLTRSLTPLWAVTARILLSAVMLFILFPKKVLTASWNDWKVSSIQSLVMVGVFISLTFGLFYSTASKQSFIGGLNVILVPLFIWAIYKERPGNWVFLSAVITTAGLLVMGFTPGMEFNFGDFLSFIMAIFYAMQVLGASWCVRRVEPVRLVALHIIILAAIMTPIALAFEPLPTLSQFTPKVIASLLCVSLCNTVLCFIVQFRAQKVSPETHVAIILSLESLFGYITSVASGQDPFHLQGAIGGLMILIGMIATELESILKKD